jgi:serine/threonine-protein kinase
MGEVYQVRNTISDRIEAMKVLPAALQSNKELQERFLREIKISAALRHPHIAELRTAQRVDGLLVMVMEFVDGVTLDYLTRNGPLPLKNALHYTKQVLDALGFAHQRGVVHRDIKPQNVMVTEGDSVRLMDFGIARSLGEQTLTMTGMTLGSLFYMSPEQIRGDEVDARSDLYSMGVLLYEMTTGQRPFQGTSGYTVMAAHLEKAPPPPIERNPDLPAALNDVILRALSKDPSSRFQSAAAFKAEIERLDEITKTKLDRMILTRAFEVKAAELPAEAMTLASREGSVTQTMPNTPTPGKGRPVPGRAPVSPELTAPGFTKKAADAGDWRPHQQVAMVFGLLIALVSVAGIFGPNLIREWRNRGDAQSLRSSADPNPADSAVNPANGSETATSGSMAKPAPGETAGASSSASASTASPTAPQAPVPPVPATAGNPAAATSTADGNRMAPPPAEIQGQPWRPGGPPPDGRMPPEFEAEVRETMRKVEADLKAAGIDMKLVGPEAREGRRFAALERAQQFADVAKRYGNAAARRSALERQREEMGRRPLQEINRRLRGRIGNEMGDHWRKLSESLGAAEAAIKSQNLTLAAEKLTIAEREMDAIDSIMATFRAETANPPRQ